MVAEIIRILPTIIIGEWLLFFVITIFAKKIKIGSFLFKNKDLGIFTLLQIFGFMIIKAVKGFATTDNVIASGFIDVGSIVSNGITIVLCILTIGITLVMIKRSCQTNCYVDKTERDW